MWPTEFTPLEALDLALPEPPPRSRLFALAPRGVGTDMAESLSSYLVRLARAHAVNPRCMVREEFRSLAEAQLRRPARHADEVASMNGYGQHAQAFAEVTARLTTRPEVRYLTLLPLSDLLPRNGAGVIARQPRWCPECVAEMDEPFRPLVWALDLYTVCHRHRRLLVAACPSCRKGQPYLPTYPDLAHCAYCGETLHGSPKATPAAATMSEQDLWMAEALGDLVARLQDLDGTATRERFLAFIAAAVERRSNGNKAAFCREMGLSPWALKNWQTRGERPSLPQLMAVSYGMGTPPAAMFASCPGEPGQIRRVQRSHAPRSRTPLQPSNRRHLADTLSRIAADTADRRSLAQLSRDLKVSASWLRYWFPDECAVVCARRNNAKRQALAERRVGEYEVVANVVRDMTSRAEYPARRKVNEALRGLHLSLAQQDMVEAYRAAVREFWNSNRLIAN